MSGAGSNSLSDGLRFAMWALFVMGLFAGIGLVGFIAWLAGWMG